MTKKKTSIDSPLVTGGDFKGLTLAVAMQLIEESKESNKDLLEVIKEHREKNPEPEPEISPEEDEAAMERQEEEDQGLPEDEPEPKPKTKKKKK